MSLEKALTTYKNTTSKPECIIASNRGPIEYYVEAGEYKMRLGSGGLVTALLGAARQRHMVWIALSMTETDRQGSQTDRPPSDVLPPAMADILLRLLSIPEQTYRQYYYAISNHILWFAQHALLEPILETTFTQQTREDWEEGYYAANKIVANAIIRELEEWGSDIPVMLQDYQLYLVAGMVRARYPDVRLSHVIYIPWPDARYLAMLPDYMVQAIYQSMATNDIIGFQTLNDARNFLVGAERFLSDAQMHWEHGSKDSPGTLRWQEHTTQVRLYPATLSTQYLHSMVQSPEAESEMSALKAQLHAGQHRQLIVRVDRIEPTKNIVRGFMAYERLLQMHPELRGHVTWLALLVPSRESLENYRLYEQEVRAIIARINEQYGQEDWQPILAAYGNNRVRALAGLQAYDVLVVNPVIDGLNLVVKEGALLNNNSGVIILSRTVGVHDTVGEHVLSITPLDIDATAKALYRGLTMPQEERTARAEKMRELLLREDATQLFSMQIEELRSRR